MQLLLFTCQTLLSVSMQPKRCKVNFSNYSLMQFDKFFFHTNRVGLFRHQSLPICGWDHRGPVASLTFDIIVDCWFSHSALFLSDGPFFPPSEFMHLSALCASVTPTIFYSLFSFFMCNNTSPVYYASPFCCFFSFDLFFIACFSSLFQSFKEAICCNNLVDSQ